MGLDASLYLQAARKATRFAGDEALQPWLVHGGSDSYERSGVRVLGWQDAPYQDKP